MFYTKDELKRKLHKDANSYALCLCNRNILIMYSYMGEFKHQSILNDMECSFFDYNFFHLTGLVMPRSYTGTKQVNNILFYNKCLSNTLTEKDIIIKDNTTYDKISQLDAAIHLKKPLMHGNFTYYGINLKADRAIGNNSYSLCFVKPRGNNFYVPNSLLRQDIKVVASDKLRKIYVMYRKSMNSVLYNECIYMAKDVDVNALYTQAYLSSVIYRLDIQNMKYVKL